MFLVPRLQEATSTSSVQPECCVRQVVNSDIIHNTYAEKKPMRYMYRLHIHIYSQIYTHIFTRTRICV